MNNLKGRLIIAAMTAVSLFGAEAATAPRAYGVQIYSSADAEGAGTQKLVSFAVDAPNTITTEMELPGMNIRGACCDGNKYYLVQSDDGMVPSSLWSLNLDTRRMERIADYPMDSPASTLLISDMTYDVTTGQIYVVAFDLANAIVGDDDTVDAPFGLFTLNPADGKTALVGFEDFVAFSAIAADSDGYLWGVDDAGDLWEINKSTGLPLDIYASSGIPATGLQSMSFDSASGILYWASCDGWNVECAFNQFVFLPDMVEYAPIAQFEQDNEIIGLYVNPDPIAADAPQQAADFVVVPAPDGEHAAYLTWTNPNRDIEGKPLTGTIDIAITRGNETIAQLTGLVPGAAESYTDQDVPNGLYDYCLIPSNSAGQGRESYALDVYIGVDQPQAPHIIGAVKSLDNYDITVTWQAPTQGLHNGWFDASSLAYKIVRLPDNKVLAESTTDTSITDTSIISLAGYSYQVTSFTSTGQGGTAISPVVVSGPALSLPAIFTFRDADERNLWTSVPTQAYGNVWEGYCFSAIDLWCMRYFPDQILPSETDPSWIVSPPMQLSKDSHYRLSYDLRTYGMLAPAEFTVKYGVQSNPADMDFTLCHVESIEDDGMLFESYTHDFVSAVDGPANVAFGIGNLVPAWLANVKLVELNAQDLAVERLDGISVCNVGTPSTFVATVRNVGYEPLSNPMVWLVDERGARLTEGSLNVTLEPNQSASVSLSWTPTAVGPMTLYAVCPDDGNNLDNTSPALDVQVLEPGEWHVINNGRFESAVTPTYLSYPYSYAQMLYTADQLNAQKSTLRGIMYYYYCYNNRSVEPFDIKVYLANTQVEALDLNAPIDPSEFTLVYDGTIAPDPYGSMMPIIFDRDFEYSGGNLLIAVEQSNSGGNTDLRYRCGYGDIFDGRTIYYRGDTPYDGTMTDSIQELANVAVLISLTGGVSDVAIDSNAALVGTAYYTASGIKIAAPCVGVNMRIDTYSDGTRIVTKIVR